MDKKLEKATKLFRNGLEVYTWGYIGYKTGFYGLIPGITLG